MAAMLVLFVRATSAFAPTGAALRSRACAVRMADDPTANPFVQAINAFTVAINESPVSKFKVGLAKLQAGSYDEGATRARVDELIASNAVTMFSFTTCPFCIKAQQLLDEMGATYKVVQLDQNAFTGGYAMRAVLAERTGRTSVPAIFIGGQFVGGCNDGGLGGVVTLDKKGELRPMLEAAGALKRR
ncbi:hypothetical protein KFE25_005568 [Diacronema lutheri]|uniref:Glutaredoxin domain-containing protein n=1 Tax=Diacronema lutheri TaxID=2081491 RepID=A0A8J6CFT7_DIALT|nr:hypothetical protein KFE25_005568 [Diacronema lutheri]